ncbi:MAG: (2Fe-2S)-binding protein [Bdellovibrionaceae bacterium]|nr:(2Fe-2S)-binding protein [Pseudobdellovibrionaceae bacterium]
MNPTQTWTALLHGRDLLEATLENGTCRLRLIGCEALLQQVRALRERHGDDPQSWALPAGSGHTDMLIRELILKRRGEWDFPYKDAEICHCRLVATVIVDQAIVTGAHTPEVVSRWTSASTSCGTCRPDVEKIIAYRLGKTS